MQRIRYLEVFGRQVGKHFFLTRNQVHHKLGAIYVYSF